MQLGVLAVEMVLQTVDVADTLPLAHGQVVKQIVAAGLGLGGRHAVLCENPFKAFDGEAAHVFDGVGSRHDDVHAGEAAHGAYVDHVVLHAAVAEPCGHEVFQAVNGGRSNGWLLVGLGDANVESGEAFVLARHVDAWLQVGVVDGETLYDFHICSVVFF